MRSQPGTIWTAEVKMMDYGFLSQQQNLAFPERLAWNGTESAANWGTCDSAGLYNCIDNFPFQGSFA
jgi:hypothetical protein